CFQGRGGAPMRRRRIMALPTRSPQAVGGELPSQRRRAMLSQGCLHELRTTWLPKMTDARPDRLGGMLGSGSPPLGHRPFTRAVPMGCLATHVAWTHPRTGRLTHDAGVVWLSKVAGLNPATSHVVRAWDLAGPSDLEVRGELLRLFREEQARRRADRRAGVG